MGYKVNFDSLDSLHKAVSAQSDNWAQELETIREKVQTLIDSSNMSGQAAENIKSYFENVHMTLIGLMNQLIAVHKSYSMMYIDDYQRNVDTDTHALLLEDEINHYHTTLSGNKSAIAEVDTSLRQTLSDISDIVTITCPDASNVTGEYDGVLTFLTELDEQIRGLEDQHHKNDFADSSEMISALKAFVQEQNGKSRSFKTEFTVDDLASSATFRELYNAYLNLGESYASREAELNLAVEHQTERAEILQQEYEERQKKAQVFKWIVTAVCIVGSIAATVATAGAASGLAAVAIGGAISATSSVITTAAGNLADQYTEFGYDHSKYDWGDLGHDVVVAGVSGFVTGAVGSGLGVAAQSTKIGSTVLNSSNSLVRLGGNAVLGSTQDVICGIVSRGADGLINPDGQNASLKEVFSLKNIVMDATSGAVGSTLGGTVNEKLGDAFGDALHSNSKITRTVTSAGIGIVSEVSTGVISRGAGTLLTTGDVGEAVDSAFDGGSMLMDAGTGAVGGVADSMASNKAAQDRADEAAKAYNEKHDPMADAEKAGITGVKQTDNKGLDFKETDAILRTDEGEVVEIKIKSTGDRRKDYLEAERIAKEQGVDLDLKGMRERKKDAYVWHHVDDYNATTNETTMQFIKRDAHKAIRNHAGSSMQYAQATGSGYDKHVFDQAPQSVQMSEVSGQAIEGSVNSASNSYASGGYASFDNIRMDAERKKTLDARMSGIINKRPGTASV